MILSNSYQSPHVAESIFSPLNSKARYKYYIQVVTAANSVLVAQSYWVSSYWRWLGHKHLTYKSIQSVQNERRMFDWYFELQTTILTNRVWCYSRNNIPIFMHVFLWMTVPAVILKYTHLKNMIVMMFSIMVWFFPCTALEDSAKIVTLKQFAPFAKEQSLDWITKVPRSIWHYHGCKN